MTLVQDSGPEWLFCGDCQVSFCWERSYLYLSSVSWSEVGQCARRSRLEHRKVLTDSLFLPDIGSSREIVFHVDWVCTAQQHILLWDWAGEAQPSSSRYPNWCCVSEGLCCFSWAMLGMFLKQYVMWEGADGARL